MNFRKLLGTGLLITTFTALAIPASAVSIFPKKKKQVESGGLKPTASQNALIDKAIVREKAVIKVIKERAPLVETYIQNMRPDPVLLQAPESDQHFLGRVEFGKIIGDASYEKNPGNSKESKGKIHGFMHSMSFLSGVSGSLRLTFHESGFVQMILMDSNDFDRQHYSFAFVRNDFLGSIPTAVFDVTPIEGRNATGRFFGRVWIETRNGNVVRFNGDFSGSEKTIREYYHFDSWRTNIQPDLWLPTSFYVEESDPKSQTNSLKFKAINHIWGYALKVPPTQAENTSEEVVGATDVSNDAQDVSPLGAQRAWVQQAEDNVIDRFFQAGLLDAPSDFDKTLEALANNILVYNNITLSSPIRCRTLLTEPLESLAIGNTIVLSKSLLDTTAVITADGAQQTANLNALLAFQLAHIILGHRLDTKYAFNDRLLFPSTSVFQRIPMHHTNAENTAAAKKAIELLNAKELVDGQRFFGLYLSQLQERVTSLHALNEPVLGDALVRSDQDDTFWLAAMMPKGGKLNMNDPKQLAAMPLSSFLRFDPWTDRVIAMHTAIEPILGPADKIPFEVAPVYLKLAYYKPPVDPAVAPAAAPAPPHPQPAQWLRLLPPPRTTPLRRTPSVRRILPWLTPLPRRQSHQLPSSKPQPQKWGRRQSLPHFCAWRFHPPHLQRCVPPRTALMLTLSHPIYSPRKEFSVARRFLLVVLFLLLPHLLHAQASHTATRVGDLQIGGGVISAQSDYASNRYKGLFGYADFDFKEHFGAEFEIHQIYSPDGDDVHERSYEIGGRYLRTYGPFVPYAKIMVGRGVFNFPRDVANLAYNIYAGGIGADYKATSFLHVRGEYEYQRWTGFQNSTLSPSLVSVGVAYHFRGNR